MRGRNKDRRGSSRGGSEPSSTSKENSGSRKSGEKNRRDKKGDSKTSVRGPGSSPKTPSQLEKERARRAGDASASGAGGATTAGKGKKKWDFSQGRATSKYPDKLRFTAYAFAKMNYMRDKGSTEISGFALTDSKDPYLVIDFVMPKQECGPATTEMSAEGLVEMFDRLSGPEKFGGLGISPSRYGRIWIHTHPGFSSEPSGTDWSTFRETFGGKDWAIMFILSSEHLATCILQIEDVPGTYFRIPWGVDWDYDFPGSDFKKWDKEYKDKVTARSYTTSYGYDGYGYDYTYRRTSTALSKYGDCAVCKKKQVWLYECSGKRMCWNCKEKVLDQQIGGNEKTATTDDDTLPGMDYSKWDEVMEDKAPSTMPAACDGCGEDRYLLDEVDGQWLCWSCQKELRDKLLKEELDDIDEIDDTTFGAEAEDMDEDKSGGFVTEEAPLRDEEYNCDRCLTPTKIAYLIEGGDDYEDEYVCQKCWDEELDEIAAQAAEEGDEGGEQEGSSGGFADEEEEETVETARDGIVPADPLDRWSDDPGRAPIM